MKNLRALFMGRIVGKGIESGHPVVGSLRVDDSETSLTITAQSFSLDGFPDYRLVSVVAVGEEPYPIAPISITVDNVAKRDHGRTYILNCRIRSEVSPDG